MVALTVNWSFKAFSEETSIAKELILQTYVSNTNTAKDTCFKSSHFVPLVLMNMQRRRIRQFLQTIIGSY